MKPSKTALLALFVCCAALPIAGPSMADDPPAASPADSLGETAERYEKVCEALKAASDAMQTDKLIHKLHDSNEEDYKEAFEQFYNHLKELKDDANVDQELLKATKSKWLDRQIMLNVLKQSHADLNKVKQDVQALKKGDTHEAALDQAINAIDKHLPPPHEAPQPAAAQPEPTPAEPTQPESEQPDSPPAATNEPAEEPEGQSSGGEVDIDDGLEIGKVDEVSKSAFANVDAFLRRPLVREIPASRSLSELPGNASDEATNADEDQKEWFVCDYRFDAPAHFPLPTFGPNGNAKEQEGLLIYEGMRFAVRHDGRYQLRFVAGTPAMPVTMRLQLVLADDAGNQFTVTIPPISIPELAKPKLAIQRLDVHPVHASLRTVHHEGYLPVLANCSEAIRIVRRQGSARFGYGVDVP